jgi:manganese/zinc/iron transport system substrate-binding protein
MLFRHAICFLLAFLLGCAGSSTEDLDDAGHVAVVCTTGMVVDLAQRIGGDRVRVIGLMGPGVDPHYYKASQGDLAKLDRADVIFYNGLSLEGKMQDIFGKMARIKRIVAVADAIDKADLLQPDELEGHYDPHIWFDVSLWSKTIDPVVRALSEIDSEGAESYQRNGDSYRKELYSLDAWVTEQIEQIPIGQRVLITAHDAFGYFGQAYGIEVMGLQGISTVAEYGVNDVTRLVDFISERKIRAIFVESSVPERSIEAVRQGCLQRGHTVSIGGTLFSDAMGGQGSGADTYVGMVRSNVETVVGALR